jgi:predicted DNA-binding WGR domain protein
MNVLGILLHARNPERNIARAYTLRMGQDLFGNWIVQIIYGRIGTKGIVKNYLCDSKEQALEKVREILKRRKSAPQRLGCPYKKVECLADQEIQDSLILDEKSDVSDEETLHP